MKCRPAAWMQLPACSQLQPLACHSPCRVHPYTSCLTSHQCYFGVTKVTTDWNVWLAAIESLFAVRYQNIMEVVGSGGHQEPVWIQHNQGSIMKQLSCMQTLSTVLILQICNINEGGCNSLVISNTESDPNIRLPLVLYIIMVMIYPQARFTVYTHSSCLSLSHTCVWFLFIIFTLSCIDSHSIEMSVIPCYTFHGNFKNISSI